MSEPLLFLHADEEEWVRATVVELADALERAIAVSGEARLLLSGGGTPVPVDRALARAPLPWGRITVGLVDERWVPASDVASNALLVRKTLLEHSAQADAGGIPPLARILFRPQRPRGRKIVGVAVAGHHRPALVDH